ncbi:MAG TPA: hypothetical protein VFH73_12230 [Polyangia bacterium]|jgi:hypothetical protein|nr:hypothetical protein [Polyangia bacterium]
MLSTLVTILVIIAVGTRASDNLTLRQQEIILSRLPEADGVAYYNVLRRRVRKIRFLRALTLLSLLAMVYSYRHNQRRISVRPAPPAATAPAQPAP